MIDLKQFMLDELKNTNQVEVSAVKENEIIIDTELEKTEENIQKVAIKYLDEKGYQKRVDNLDRAKQMILECSEHTDTVCYRSKNVEQTDLFAGASIADLRDVIHVCVLDTVTSMNKQMNRMSNPQFEYKVETVERTFVEKERPHGTLTGSDFETFEEMLNRNAKRGWILFSTFAEKSQTVAVFRREKM